MMMRDNIRIKEREREIEEQIDLLREMEMFEFFKEWALVEEKDKYEILFHLLEQRGFEVIDKHNKIIRYNNDYYYLKYVELSNQYFKMVKSWDFINKCKDKGYYGITVTNGMIGENALIKSYEQNIYVLEGKKLYYLLQGEDIYLKNWTLKLHNKLQ